MFGRLLRTPANRFTRLVLGFKYLKLSLFAASVCLAYAFFSRWGGGVFVQNLADGAGLAMPFLAGVLYAFGFTSAFAAGAFVLMNHGKDFLLVALAGGLGAFSADYLILKFVRLSFKDEFNRLKASKAFRRARDELHLPRRLKQYFLLAMAGFFIASPLPDEIGVSLLAGFTDIDEKEFALVSFSLNTLGIMVLLAL